MRHRVIYIFGLGDHRARGQTQAIKLWRLYGVKSEVFHMYWRDGEPFAPKLAQLLEKIDDCAAAGENVSLVGVSAGASAALNAFAARPAKISGIALFAGKVHNPQDLSPQVLAKNRSFGESMVLLPASLTKLSATERSRILSMHPLADRSVPPEDTLIAGAHERTIWLSGHILSIAYGITFYAPVALHFLKRQAKMLAKQKN